MAASPLRIDFVSDVACPWCAVGLWSLDRAIERLGDEVPVELHFEPFELNPTMPPEGEDAVEYIARKYGRPPEAIAQTRALLRERGAAVGFAFGERERIWNTFDAHRLLHWAGLESGPGQSKLKHALLAAYHARSENPGDREVRARERHWQQLGIHGVPAAVVSGRHLISGGQPPEVFEQALRQIAAAAS